MLSPALILRDETGCATLKTGQSYAWQNMGGMFLLDVKLETTCKCCDGVLGMG